MSNYKKSIRSKHYWIAYGQGVIYKMLKEGTEKRGDSAELARKIGTTQGYVSQMLSGDAEINPTWKKIVEFCLALDKVPVLEIKNIDDYLIEQNKKTSNLIYNNSFYSNCLNAPIQMTDIVREPIHFNIKDIEIIKLIQQNQKNENPINEPYSEFEILI